MSLEAQKWVWENSPYKGGKLIIHLVIADKANDDNGNLFFLSNRNLAERARVTRPYANTTLQQMVEEGYLEHVGVHPDPRYKGVVEYRFLMPEEGVNSVNSDEGHVSTLPNEGVNSDDEGVNFSGPTCSQSEHKTKINPSEDQEEDQVSLKDPVQAVWNAYVDACKAHNPNSRGLVLDSKRRNLIERQLKLYSVEDLVLAVTGWLKSDWHTGGNPGGKTYNKLDRLIGDADRIEMFIGFHEARKPRQRDAVNEAHGREPRKAPTAIILSDDDEDFV